MNALLASINATRLKRLLLLRWLTQSSDGLFQTGLGAFVLFSPEQAPSAFTIASGFALILLPYSGLGPFVGTLLDRYHRRTVIVTANLIRSGLLLVIALLVATKVSETLLAPLVLISFGLSRLTLAGFSAGLPRLVPDTILVPSNALAVTGGTVAAVIGGGVGFGIRALIGLDAVIIATAAAVYAVAAATAFRLTLDELGPHEEERHLAKKKSVWVAGWSDVTTALSYLTHKAVATRAIIRIALVRGALSALLVVAIVAERERLGESQALTSLALVAGLMGVGSLIGAVLAPQLVLRFTRDEVMNSMMLTAAPFALLLLTELPPWMGLMAMALCGQALKVTADAQVQQNIEDEFRGRVFAVYDVTVNLLIVLGAFLTALVPASPIVVTATLTAATLYFWRSSHH